MILEAKQRLFSSAYEMRQLNCKESKNNKNFKHVSKIKFFNIKIRKVNSAIDKFLRFFFCFVLSLPVITNNFITIIIFSRSICNTSRVVQES